MRTLYKEFFHHWSGQRWLGGIAFAGVQSAKIEPQVSVRIDESGTSPRYFQGEKQGVAFAGTDVGSVASKAVILLNDNIVGFSEIPTSVNVKESGLLALQKALEMAGISKEELRYVVATGYGRVSASFANKVVTEISCHAKGASFLNPKARTVIDIGGQDSKVIKLGPNEQVVDFVMNDKCAAGTGRFLEVISSALGASLDNLGPTALMADYPCPINSTCTVFAESEVISLLARGEKRDNIIKGIHYAIARRVAGMISRIGGAEREVIFTGGVAKNVGVKKALEEILGIEILVPENPQLVGALGASLFAKTYANNQSG